VNEKLKEVQARPECPEHGGNSGRSGRKGTGDREKRSGPRTRVPAAIGGV